MIRVVYNPVAGPKAVRRIDAVRQFLAREAVPFEIAETGAHGQVVELAAEAARAGCETVVAVGDQATVNGAVNGLAGTATALLVVPEGTDNLLAREVGLPDSVEGCLSLLERGETIEIPLAKAESRYFVLMGSAGFDAEVVERMESQCKNAFGTLAYILAGARHLLRPQPTLWMEFPGRERIDAQLIIVCRGRTYGRVVLNTSGRLDGTMLHVIALRRPGRLSIVRFALAALRGLPLRSPDVLVREADTVLVRCRIPSAAQIDGDYLGPLPVRFSMTPATLRLIVPRKRSPSTVF